MCYTNTKRNDQSDVLKMTGATQGGKRNGACPIFLTQRGLKGYHLSSAQRGSKSMAADNKFAQNTLKEVSKNAYHRLGQVNATDGRFDEAADHFAKAMEVAKSANQQKDEEVSLAMLGIARGMLSFDEHCAVPG
ncbi:Hypothetical protein SCF082_LOCUS14225 [Durusdinium trenchii]|uniref:Uncharacterized protein n=1 Tax=Durusdinium trenchii TaxID=1381693 RepID=A0ABP0JWV6_9DINO